MSLLELPTEVVQLICAHADSATVQSIRLACHGLRDIADEHLLIEVYAVYETASFKKLQEIAKGPANIRKTITSFFFQADSVDEPQYSEAWSDKVLLSYLHQRAAIKDILKEWSSKSMSVWQRNQTLALTELANSLKEAAHAAHKEDRSQDELLDRTQDRYDALCERQFGKGHDRLLETAFKELFRACPAINMLRFNTRHTLQPNRCLLNHVFQSGLVIPHTSLCEQDFLPILKLARNAGLKIRSLDFGGIEHYPLSYHKVRDAYPLLQDVESLRWTFPTPDKLRETESDISDSFATAEEAFGKGCLYRWLKECRRLVNLRLEMATPPHWHWRTDLSCIVKDIHWEHLASLDLRQFSMESSSTLPDFLLRHQETLKKLTLGHMVILHGTWDECFAAFAGKLHLLQTAELLGDFVSADDEEFFLDYRFEEGGTSADVPDHTRCGMIRYILDGGDLPRKIERWLDESDDEENSGHRPSVVARNDEDTLFRAMHRQMVIRLGDGDF